jgi:hypothetical protein
MKNIGYQDVETYVRTMISEGFGAKTENNKKSTTERKRGARTEPSPTSMKTKANQKEKEVSSKDECRYAVSKQC